MRAPRLLVIGIDGATLDLIGPWAREGKLPALRGLMESGVTKPLRSTLPPVTPVAWSSFLTGADPGGHGIYSFFRLDHSSYRPLPVHAGHRRLPSFWQSLSQAGVAVGQFNTPFTYPVEPLNGFAVAGFDTPTFGRDAAYPDGALETALNGDHGYVHGPVPLAPRETYHERLRKQAMTQVRMCGRLLQRWPCDVFMVTFCATDHGAHRLWPLGATTEEVARVGGDVLEAYQVADEAIGEILERHADDGTTVLVVSDHGMGPAEGAVNMTRVLAEAGLLRVRPEAGRDNSIPLRLRAVRGVRRFFRDGAGRVLKPLALRLMPEWAKAAVAHTELSSIDWERTLAFPWGTYGQVQINREGEWAEGCVGPRDADAVARDVTQAFEELRDPASAGPVIDEVAPAEEIYAEERAPGSPDLLVIPHDYSYDIGPYLQSPEGPPVANSHTDGGEWIDVPAIHRLEGTLIASGPCADRISELESPRLEDIASVILRIAGVSSDGESVSTQPDGSPYTEEQARQVERHLEDLGYL